MNAEDRTECRVWWVLLISLVLGVTMAGVICGMMNGF